MSRCLVAAWLASIVIAQTPDGEALFKRRCAACHNGEPASHAPAAESLHAKSPESIIESLVNGSMRVPGSRLSGGERRAIAEFLTGRKIGGDVTGATTGLCATHPGFSDPAAGPAWNGWGPSITNTRFQKDAGLTAEQVTK